MFSKLLSSTFSVILMAVSLLGAVEIGAATYYTATNGNDSNPGTESKPFRTVRKGVSVLSGGDTLRIRGGTYDEVLNDTSGVYLSSTHNGATIEGYQNEFPTLRAPQGSVGTHVITMIGTSGVTLRKFKIDGQNPVATNHVGKGFCIAEFDGGNNTFDGLEVADCWHNHISLHWGGSGGNVIRNSYLHGGIDNLESLYIQNSNNLIEGNRFEDFNGCAANVRGGIEASGNVVRGNIMRNVLMGLCSSNQSWNNRFYNNVISNVETGIQVYAGYNEFFNNTIYNASRYAVESVTGVLLKNNIFYNGGLGSICRPPGTLKTGHGCVNPIADSTANLEGTAPNNFFANPAGGDFHLRSSSPARDAGVRLTEVLNDFKGVLRPQGTQYDIGAYEYTDTTITMPTNLRIVSR